MCDPRWDDSLERDDGRARVYDESDRTGHDPRDGLMRDLDLPRGDARELVVDRDRVYALNGEDSRTLGAECPYSGAIRWGGQAQGICRDRGHGNRVADHVEELDRVSFFAGTNTTIVDATESLSRGNTKGNRALRRGVFPLSAKRRR